MSARMVRREPSLSLIASLKVWLSDVRRLARLESKLGDPSVSLGKRLWLWRNGFCSMHRSLYGLDRQNAHLYLDNLSYRGMHPINGDYSALIDNKAFLPLFISKVAEVYVVMVGGEIRYAKIGEYESRDGLYDHLDDYVSRNQRPFIGKPLKASGGDGLFVINHSKLRSMMERLASDRADVIINEMVEQHPYSSDIFGGSVNTIRLNLIRAIDDSKLFVARAFHRFGTNRSSPVDNGAKGGLVVPIDLATGGLCKGLIYDQPRDGWHSRHPDTGHPIEGVEIPSWASIVSDVVSTFDHLQWFDYGGLDIVATPSDYVILEVNSLPDPEGMQLCRPLLDDANIRAFFDSKGLRRKRLW